MDLLNGDTTLIPTILGEGVIKELGNKFYEFTAPKKGSFGWFD